jgi:putative toxin-antitoxin system antitoxin component (TIGR02293 family)
MTVSALPQLTHSPQEVLTQLLGLSKGNRLQVIEAVTEGLEVSAFERVATALGVTEKRLAELVRITPSTLARRKRSGILSSEESERLYRIAFLIERAVQVLGRLEDAQRWLDAGKRALGGATPLVFAKTEPGAREVEDLLGRIEYGIPS